MTPEQISEFLDSAIRNRLAVRLLAEQHIAISRDLQHPELASKDHIGVVELSCSPAKMIRMVGSFVAELCEATLGISPEIVIDGEVDATFA
jgi:26S proteasome regulatory subunit T1